MWVLFIIDCLSVCTSRSVFMWRLIKKKCTHGIDKLYGVFCTSASSHVWAIHSITYKVVTGGL